MMSRSPDNYTEEELLRIARPVDPSLPCQRVKILIGSKVMMVSTVRDHSLFEKYTSLVSKTIFNSILDAEVHTSL